MGLAILVISLFITLLVNSTGKSLILLDWYIVMALMGKYVFFSDIFVRAVAGKVALSRRNGKKERGKKDAVEDILEDCHGGDDAERARREELLRAGLGVHRANYALEDAENHNDDADELVALRHALTQFGRAVDGSEVYQGYAPPRVNELTDSHKSFRRDTFTEDFIRAAETYGLSHAQATKAEKKLRNAAKTDYRSARSRETVAEIREGLQAVRPLDMLTIGIICVSWAAFQFVRPWLYWEGIDRGEKQGCDVKLLWFFVPASIYDDKFRAWLKTWTVVMVILGVFYLLYGLLILGTNMFKAREWFERQTADSDMESQRGLLGRDGSRSSHGEIEERGAMRGKRKYKHKGRAGHGRRQFFRVIAGLQLALLAVTMAITEGTIALNHLDMTHGHFKSSSELMAFFVALVTAVPVFWECLVIAPLRWYLRRTKKGSEWEREDREREKRSSRHLGEQVREEPEMSGAHAR